MTRVLLGLALALAGAGVSGCPNALPVSVPGLGGAGQSDQEQIAAVLDDVHQGMQRRRIYRVLAHVSRAYQDEQGRDYEAIQAYLNEIFSAYRSIRIVRAQPKIYVQGDEATVIETFGTTAEPATTGDYPPLNLQGNVNVRLQQVDGRWLITQWGPLN